MRRIWLPLTALLGVLAIGGLPVLAITLAEHETGQQSVSTDGEPGDRGWSRDNGGHRGPPPGRRDKDHARPDKDHSRGPHPRFALPDQAAPRAHCLKIALKPWLAELKRESQGGRDDDSRPEDRGPRLSKELRALLREACDELRERPDA